MMAARLVASVGLAKARFMIFTASELNAAEAAAIGLVGAVVEHDRLDEHVEWALQQIRLTGPGARAALKREINSSLPSADMTLFGRVPSAEMMEGMASFVEKRPPVWRDPTE
jgi:enoyl-CoA hydratase/carnithine racemase